MKTLRRIVADIIRTRGYEIRKIVPSDIRRKAELAQRRLDSWKCIREFQVATIIDIGANVGQFASIARSLFSDTPIVSFEPLSQCYQQLVEKKSSLEPFHPVHSALGCTAGNLTINRSASTASSSFLEMADLHKRELPQTAVSHKEVVQVSVLDEVLPSFGFTAPFFIKIDVQGFELQVLQGAVETLKQTCAIVVEISSEPLYTGEPAFDTIYCFLRTQGFRYCGNIDQWRSEPTGTILQFDCLFKRETALHDSKESSRI